MASIGLRNAKYNQIDYATKKYKALVDSLVPVLGRLIDAKITEDRNNTTLRADDRIAEKDLSFKGGTVNITIDDVTDKTYADLKGCTMNEEKEVTDNSEDIAPEIGYGHIVTKIYKGVKSYKVEFLPRIQITKITADRKTKGESLEYNTVSIEANVMELEEEINGMKVGDWKKVKSFTTLAEAQTYLDGLLTPAA